MSDDVYHKGEVLIQERSGERAAAIANGRMIKHAIPAAAADFIAKQRAVVVAASAPDGALWVAFVTGEAGFAAASEDLKSVILAPPDTRSVLDTTPPFAALHAGEPLGLLFIDLPTRRRLRVNGIAEAYNAGRLQISVQEAFPNCPKYIHRRIPVARETMTGPAPMQRGKTLDVEVLAWIARADTLFVASAGPDGGIDASHRGGTAGFVTVHDGWLLIPDYPGNSMFKTLGNFALSPRAGITFVDFENARQLQLTGGVELRLGIREEIARTGGTGRWWAFKPEHWIAAPWNAPLGWKDVDASPFNP